VTTSVHHREATLDPTLSSLATRLASLDPPLDLIFLLPRGLGLLTLSTMSRRESRVSMNDRQSDALFEFENCMCLPHFRTSHADPSLHIPSYSQEVVSARQ